MTILSDFIKKYLEVGGEPGGLLDAMKSEFEDTSTLFKGEVLRVTGKTYEQLVDDEFNESELKGFRTFSTVEFKADMAYTDLP